MEHENIAFYDDFKPVKKEESQDENLKEKSCNQMCELQLRTKFSLATNCEKMETSTISSSDSCNEKELKITDKISRLGISWHLLLIVFINFSLGCSSLFMVLSQILGRGRLMCSCTINEQASKYFTLCSI